MNPRDLLALKLAMTPDAYQRWLTLGFTEGDAATLIADKGHVKLAAADMLGSLVNLARSGGGKVKVGPIEMQVPATLYAERAAALRAEVAAETTSAGPFFTEIS